MEIIRKNILSNISKVNSFDISAIETVDTVNNNMKTEILVEKFFYGDKLLYNVRLINIYRNKLTLIINYLTPYNNKLIRSLKKNKEDNICKEFLIGLNENNINNLSIRLERIHNKPIEIVLIKFNNPYSDRNIMAQYIGIQSNKKNFKRIMNNMIKKMPLINEKEINSNGRIITYALGREVKAGGRLISERSMPRKTVSIASKGSFLKKNNKTCLKKRKFTIKNSKGSVTINVKMNHGISSH
jgi:hypothetical protein